MIILSDEEWQNISDKAISVLQIYFKGILFITRYRLPGGVVLERLV